MHAVNGESLPNYIKETLCPRRRKHVGERQECSQELVRYLCSERASSLRGELHHLLFIRNEGKHLVLAFLTVVSLDSTASSGMSHKVVEGGLRLDWPQSSSTPSGVRRRQRSSHSMYSRCCCCLTTATKCMIWNTDTTFEPRVFVAVEKSWPIFSPQTMYSCSCGR